MLKPLILFGVSRPNMYSLAKLVGALEVDRGVMDHYEIICLKKNILNLKFDESTISDYNLEDRPFIILPFSLFTTQLDRFQEFIKKELPLVLNANQNVIVITGGWHGTAMPYEMIKLGANIVIIGEGEHAFPTLLNEIYSYYQKMQSIAGFKQRSLLFGVDFYQDLSHLIQLEQLNHIAIEYNKNLCMRDVRRPIDNPANAIDLNNYPPYAEINRIFCPIEISRGCPFRCKFCQTGNYWDFMRHASIDSIVRWVEKGVKIRYHRVWFLSPNSFAYGANKGVGTNPEAVQKLLSGIRHVFPKEKGEIFFGDFPSEVRPEYVTKEMMEAVHPYINNKYFTVGAQTASELLLKKINRGHTFEDVRRAIDLINDYGYGADVDFIFGLPGETQEDVAITLDYFKEVLKGSKTIRIHTHTFMPLPGTPYANEPVGHISSEIEEMIGNLTSHNKAFGQYEKEKEFTNSLKK